MGLIKEKLEIKVGNKTKIINHNPNYKWIIIMSTIINLNINCKMLRNKGKRDYLITKKE